MRLLGRPMPAERAAALARVGAIVEEPRLCVTQSLVTNGNERKGELMPQRIVRAVSVLAAGAAVLLGGTGQPASAASPPEVTVSTTSKASAAVSGPLEGGEGDFFVALEGFAFTADGESGTNVSVDAFFGDVECLTLTSDATVTIADDLTTGRVAGRATGECFDFATEKSGAYTATFDVTWTASGRLERRSFASRSEGRICVTNVASRDAVARGTLTWSAPELGIGGTGEPFGAAGLTRLEDTCRSAG
jgi:hypothetical protein